MYGPRGGEQHNNKWLYRRHMLPEPSSSLAAAVATASAIHFNQVTPESLVEDGRKISVGDCALFKPPLDSPPFVGIIRRLVPGKEDSLSLCVNWLYRPTDVKLGKGNLLEAAPNEVFYSFHKDEIPAASLLHPCKVAFLRKGVELPPGISSFVCRRVYDIDSERLWWLTDKDYVNERQEEVDQLLDKTRVEMYGAVQSGGRSPKTVSCSTAAPQVKAGSDQNSSSSFPSLAKGGKKRELGAQGSESVKRERISRADDVDYKEKIVKLAIAKITDRGGLVDLEGVEKLVKLMQTDSVDNILDLSCRIMVANAIVVTDRFDCLTRFVELRGLPVLDDWLQQVRMGKIGDGSSPKESDKSVEDFLLTLLRALDKLPVNLHALQTCNVGKSVNHLRSHKNVEIQKKARSLVDTWKKRVEAEMNMIDAKSGSSRGGSWPKSVMSEGSNVVGRRNAGTSEPVVKTEPVVKSSSMQSCTSKNPSAKLGSGDKSSTASPGSSKLPTSVTASGVAHTKDMNNGANVDGGSSDPPLTTIKEEKSSSSSQSHNNSQSCSSDYGKMIPSREDARSSTAGSVSGNNVSSGVSRNRKLSNGLHGTVGVQKESSVGKSSFVKKSLSSKKVSPSRVVTSDRIPDVPLVDNGSNHRLIVRLPNTGRSPARSASGGSPDDASNTLCKSSPLAISEKLDHQDQKVQGRSETLGINTSLNANVDLFQGKDRARSDDVEMTFVDVERSRNGEDPDRLAEASKATICSPPRITAKSGKSYEVSYSSMNALIDSCVKFSEANATATGSGGDNLGMNLLASVATGEISRCDSPSGSPHRKSPVSEDLCSDSEDLCSDSEDLRHADKDLAQTEDHRNDGFNGDTTLDHGSSINPLDIKTVTQQNDMLPTNFSGEIKVPLAGCEEKMGGRGAHMNSCGLDLPQNDGVPLMTSDDKPMESIREDCVAKSLNVKEEVTRVQEGADQSQELTRATYVNDSKLKQTSQLSDVDKNIGCVNETTTVIGVAALPVAATANTKVETDSNEESTSCSSTDRRKDGKNTANSVSCDFNLKEKNPPDVICRKTEDAELPSGSGAISGSELVVEKADVKNLVSHTEGEEQKLGVGSSTYECSSDITRGNLEEREVTGCHPGRSSPSNLPALHVQETEHLVKSSKCKELGVENPVSRPIVSAVTAAGTNPAVILDFDLNEGFPVDDGASRELVKFPVNENSSFVQLRSPLPISISPLPGSLPSSVTFAAAAKGPFVLPENSLRVKGELGWKGSAATSAFRPAEPRKILDVPLNSTVPLLFDKSSSKHGRPLLDFDLNVPDQRALDDVAPQNSVQVTCEKSGQERSSGGLILDLNRCDESPEVGQFSFNSSCRLEIPKLPGRSSLSGGFSIAESNASRDFDLNNGPGPDEVGNEAAPHAKNSLPFFSSVPAVRMNNMDLGNFSSWFPPGTSYSAVGMPPMLPVPGRGEQNYSILPASSSQRILGSPSGSTSFGPEIYRGTILSSSPAVGFPPTILFQYPGFPFETNFQQSSNSYSVVSTAYTDSSSGGPLCYPAIPSQLMGPGVVSTQHSRPYVMSHLPDGTNAAPENIKWGSQGLDLNAGPVVPDLDRRDERLPSSLRQLPLSGSQALADEQLKMYQMAGGVLKRKEPDGGWEGDRISYKQHPSWQ